MKSVTALFNSTSKILCKINAADCRANKIRDRLLNNLKFYKLTTFLIGVSICIFLAYPSKAFIVDRQHISLLPIEFMFVDQSTLTGFLTANVIISIMGVFANVATAYTLLIIAVMTLNYSVLVCNPYPQRN